MFVPEGCSGEYGFRVYDVDGDRVMWELDKLDKERPTGFQSDIIRKAYGELRDRGVSLPGLASVQVVVVEDATRLTVELASRNNAPEITPNVILDGSYFVVFERNDLSVVEVFP